MPIDARTYFSTLLPLFLHGQLSRDEQALHGRVGRALRAGDEPWTHRIHFPRGCRQHQRIARARCLHAPAVGAGLQHDHERMHGSRGHARYDEQHDALSDERDIVWWRVLASSGVPETMRVQMDRFNTAFRLLVILPMRNDGGIELLLGTLPEEFAMLMKDKEFMEYASFLG